METIIMPQVGQDLTVGRIVEWVKQEGEAIKRGEIVVIVESEKASFEVQSEYSGVLLKRLYPNDTEVKVFDPIAYVGAAGEAISGAQASPAFETSSHASVTRPLPTEAVSRPHASSEGRQFVSPAARRCAQERGVSLESLRGSGPNGRVIKRDVLAAQPGTSTPTNAAAPASVPTAAAPIRVEGLKAPQPLSADRVVPFTRMRQRIADRLTLSKQTVPHFILFKDAQMDTALNWRRTENAKGQKFTVNDLIALATVKALLAWPALNAHVEKDRTIQKASVNLGIATSIEDGLLVPVVKDAQKLSALGLSEAIKGVVEAARRGSIDPNAVGSFTISNLGAAGIDRFVPIINPPECGILGVGSLRSAVVAHEGLIGVRQILTLTLACDHRAVDGVAAAGFLNFICTVLEQADF